MAEDSSDLHVDSEQRYILPISEAQWEMNSVKSLGSFLWEQSKWSYGYNGQEILAQQHIPPSIFSISSWRTHKR